MHVVFEPLDLLIGVNIPESTIRKETFGKEASNYTTTKLNGKKVWMQTDVTDTDRYGRQLRIIWLAIPTDDMNESEIRKKCSMPIWSLIDMQNHQLTRLMLTTVSTS